MRKSPVRRKATSISSALENSIMFFKPTRIEAASNDSMKDVYELAHYFYVLPYTHSYEYVYTVKKNK